MTIYPLQVGKTYRTRDGSAEHTISKIEKGLFRFGPVACSTGDNTWWANTGKSDDLDRPDDLVEEVQPTAPTAEGPVRRRVITTTEIVPGVYGRLTVGNAYGPDENTGHNRWLFSLNEDPSEWAALTAEELDALAATATQLADALRAIAAEKNQ